jgi:dTDP-4-dehydrorhamnose reductase
MKYLVLGAGGMAGHMITHYLLEQGEEVEGLEKRELSYCKTYSMDVTHFDKLQKIIEENNYDIIINCIGLLNQNAENNIDLAILLNSYLPHFLAKVTKNMETRVFQMSTDCVFSGKRGHYTENDFPDGETIYDRTKALGELNDEKNLTFRNSIIGPDINENGIGLFNWFMKQNGEINGFEKSIWTGVTTLTLAKAMHKASYENLTGLYNLVNNETISKYELLCLFNKYTNKGLTINKVEGVILDKSLYRSRNDFDYSVPSYEQQIKEMIQWIQNHDLYKY